MRDGDTEMEERIDGLREESGVFEPAEKTEICRHEEHESDFAASFLMARMDDSCEPIVCDDAQTEPSDTETLAPEVEEKAGEEKNRIHRAP